MKKYLTRTMSVFIVLFTMMLCSSAILANEPVVVTINGQEVNITKEKGIPFKDESGRVQVPLASVSESLGHKVEWDGKNQQAKIDGGNVVVTVGSYDVKTKNGTIKMDTKAVMKNGRVFVPVRFISEALGHKVDYRYANGINHVLIITSEDTEVPPTGNEPNVNLDNVMSYVPDPDGWGYNDTTKYWIEPDKFGYNELNTKTRLDGTSWLDDLKYLTSIMGNYMQVAFAQDGKLAPGSYKTGGEQQTGDSNSYTYITRYSEYPESRIVGTRLWPDGAPISDYSEEEFFLHNLFIESVRYFSKTPEDGNKIIAYVNGQVAKNKYPEFNTPMTFGQTTVIFEKGIRSGFEFTVCFNEWPDYAVK